MFESCLASRIDIFSKSNHLINDSQFGFRNKHSTFHALSHVSQQIYESVDIENYTIGIFIDLGKAFDSVSHKILIQKLVNQYNFPNYLVKILFNYLSNRFVKIKLGSFISEPFSLYASVLQGSIIGPLLFNLFINDICDLFSGPKDLYADDVGVIVSDPDLRNLINCAKEKLNSMNDWCSQNGMKINWSKSYFMFFHNKRMKHPPDLTEIMPALKLIDLECSERLTT
jgi:hypothetical protein